MKNIIEEYKYSIKAIIKNITGSYNEDLEQEVYIKTWKNQDKYKEQNRFKQWLNTITANTCRDYLKSSAHQKSKITDSDEEALKQVKDTNSNPENLISIQERQQMIMNAINSLSPKQREVVILFDMDGFSYEDIAQKIGCPVGTVKSRLFNARKELAISLKDLL